MLLTIRSWDFLEQLSELLAQRVHTCVPLPVIWVRLLAAELIWTVFREAAAVSSEWRMP